jgi:hypothetical protein
MEASGKLWYYLTGDGEATQTHGPFDVETMKGGPLCAAPVWTCAVTHAVAAAEHTHGPSLVIHHMRRSCAPPQPQAYSMRPAGLFNGQYITADAMVWAEGEAEWLPLHACNELHSALVFQGACHLHDAAALHRCTRPFAALRPAYMRQRVLRLQRSVLQLRNARCGSLVPGLDQSCTPREAADEAMLCADVGKKKDPQKDAQLAAFEAEIAAVEAGAPLVRAPWLRSPCFCICV